MKLNAAEASFLVGVINRSITLLTTMETCDLIAIAEFSGMVVNDASEERFKNSLSDTLHTLDVIRDKLNNEFDL